MEMELPEGWVYESTGTLFETQTGNTPSKKDPTFYGKGIPFAKPPELNAIPFSKTEDSLTNSGASVARVLPSNSVLVSCIGNIGKVGINTIPMAFNQQINAIFPSAEIADPRFIFFQTQSDTYRKRLQALSSATTISIVNRKKFDSVPLLIPPLNEQRRIVAKIEQLFGSLDKAEQALRDTQKLLATYRQAILKAAVTGELTADWRAQREGNLPSGANLVERLNKERSAYYDHEIKLWNDSVSIWERSGGQGKKPSKPRKPANVFSDDDLTFSMPDNWTLLPLGAIVAEAVLGKMLDKNKNKGSPRTYLGNINVRWGSFDMELQKTMLFEDYEIDRYSLRAGDLVVCEGGEPGRCAIWNGEDNQVFVQKALHRIRFTHSYLPSFAYYYLKFATEAGLLDKHYTGTTIKHLTGRELEQVVFPVCSLAEQQEIVQRVESSIFNARTAELCIERELQRSAALRQSILKDAFSGQLVEQDPSDEPASALLARIARERAASQPKKTTRRPVKL